MMFFNSDDEFLFDSSDSEEDFILFRSTRFDYYQETIDEYTDEEFRDHFRLSRSTALFIAERFRKSEQFTSTSGQFGNLSPINQVLIFLWFTGHQTSNFRAIADRFDITISSLHRIIRRISQFLSNLAPEFIKWPSETKKRATEAYFRRNGFSGVIGAIGSTHIKIDKPKSSPDPYINKQGCYTVHMQAVCDESGRFLDVLIGPPGPGTDRIFKNSTLFSTIKEKCGSYYILGDSGYPLMKNLLIPFKSEGLLNKVQANYNLKLSQNRCIIEEAFKALKHKFRQLEHVKLKDITYVVHFIKACCVLHNISIDNGLDEVTITIELDCAPPNPEISSSVIEDLITNSLHKKKD